MAAGFVDIVKNLLTRIDRTKDDDNLQDIEENDISVKKLANTYDKKIDLLEKTIDDLKKDLDDIANESSFKILVKRTKKILEVKSKGKWYKITLGQNAKIAPTIKLDLFDEIDKRDESKEKILE